VVHDTSQSGKTAFLEPHEIVALDNRRKLAEAELRAAEHRVLVLLSRAAAGAAPDARAAFDAALRLDLAASRASLAARLGATRPRVGDEGVVVLAQARHPVLVLRGVDVVPNDLAVTSAQPVLIVSGPNAGGKTVALKTVGLCAALVAHGCFVPASAGARVDAFRHVLAAIGDAQTVTGDRSSFSGHVAWLADMLDVAGPSSLLLLDELCTGTDPAQGAALARAVLEHLRDAGARVVVTTHYGSVKGLAAVDDRFAVSGVVLRDGRPTFVVRPGLAGQSAALEVARRAGLPDALVARAERLLDEERGAAGALVDALEGELQRAREAAEEAASTRAALDARSAALDRRQAALEARARAQVDEAAADLRARIRDAEEAVGRVVADLQRAPSHAAAVAARAAIEALGSVAPEAATEPEPDEGALPAVGVRVRDTRLNAVGEVVAHGRDGVVVRIGGITRVARPSELVALVPAPPRRGPAAVAAPQRSVAVDAAVRTADTTVDLRGMRVDDGLDAVDAFLARLAADGHDTGFVLHGHGSGALKDGVRRWLRSHPSVLKSGPSNADQGGDAFTVVRLRS
jgi:DNA mismatch repair protein MutS2